MTKKNKEKKSVNKLKWAIITIICFSLMIIIMLRFGTLGFIINSILSFLFGSLFFIPLLCLIGYGIYAIFLSHRFNKSIKVIIGLFLLNIFQMTLVSFVFEPEINFQNYFEYLSSNFFSLLKNKTVSLNFTGGIFGTLFYCLLMFLFDKGGTVISLITIAFVSLLLIIPNSLYAKWWNDFKVNRNNRKIEKQEAKKALALEKEKAKALEEDRKLKQAQEFAKINEIEATKEETKLEVVEASVTKKKKEDGILSTKSKFFINLDEEEINARKDNEPLNSEDIASSASQATPRVLKPVYHNGIYHFPPLSLLEQKKSYGSSLNKTSAKVKGEKVIEILKTFDIEAELLATHIGPSVTKFEIKPDSTVKVNKIQSIADNIKMELAAKEIRIEAPIPGRSAVGIEIPNVESSVVSMYDMMSHFPKDNKSLQFALGKDLMGKQVYCDLEKMPHLLIAGATGSGKSVCENAIITSYILRCNPDEVKLVLIDPKKVEFTPYHDIPHLLWPVITDVTMASNMLKKLVVIMEERYDAFASVGVKNIKGFNEFADEHNKSLKAEEKPLNHLPYIVIVIDELADMMAIAGKDVELSIQRITQLARASGIHLIVATQRPSTDVITGLIKNNMPSRISFALTSSIDSRTIIDQTGAEKLLGNGDMLYKPQDENVPIRIQGVYVTEEEVKAITDYAKKQAKPEYEDSYFEFERNMNGQSIAGATSVNADTQDSLYDDVVEFVREKQAASTSLLQRRFGIGYNRAARLIDTLEDKGIIGPSNGSKPREVYLKREDED